MDRRSFIKLTAVTGTSAALTSCGNPEHQLIRFVPDAEMIPGVATWVPGVCPLCASGCGVIVRVMEADVDVTRKGENGAMTQGVVRMGVAKKLEGNPAHPVSQGRLCARGQAAIQVTYHPDRIAVPLKRTGKRGEGQFKEVTWDEAIAELVTNLDGLASGGEKGLAFITSRRTGPRAALVNQFLTKFGASHAIIAETFSDDVLRRANGLSFGFEQLPTYDLARTQYVMSFGADFLGTWNSPVANGAGYGEMRQGRPGIRGKFVQFESHMTQTGANADEWVPVKPGTEGALALGLAHVIVAHKLRPASDSASRAGALIAGWSTSLTDYEPPAVEKITGVSAERIERLAHEFAAATPAMAIVGGVPLAHTNGLFTAVAVNALNALVGNINQPGGIFFTPQASQQVTADSRQDSQPPQSIDKFAASIMSSGDSPVKALLIDGGDPVFGSPRAWKVREALDKVPFIASFGSFLDDTSTLADLILPDHSFLESWTAAVPESGSTVAVTSVAKPAMGPLYQTRSTPDVLLEVSTKLKKPLELPWKTFQEMLKAASGSDEAWSAAQKQGGWWGELPKGTIAASSAPVGGRAARAFAYAEPQFDGDAGQYPFHFLPYASPSFLDGSLAHLPWLQEMPDPLTSAMWSSWVEVNTATAERLGIRDRDIVEIKSQHGTIQAAAVVSPGLAPDIVAMPVGQGHENFTRYASKRGTNPIAILASVTEPETGTLAWAATRVQISRLGDADDRLIMYAGEKREKPNEGER